MATEVEFLLENRELLFYLDSCNYTNFRYFSNRGLCAVYKNLYNTDLFTGLTKLNFKKRYRFENHDDALEFLNSWDGEEEPSGEIIDTL